MQDSNELVLANQQTIISNQNAILGNQQSIISNQEVIVSNQASIVSNQKQIVDNQVTLAVLLQSQSYVLNLLRKISGSEESLETTQQFLDTLKTETQESLRSAALTDSQSL